MAEDSVVREYPDDRWDEAGPTRGVEEVVESGHVLTFPHLPFYGAISWWFFFLIPVIGITYGYFNDWKDEQ